MYVRYFWQGITNYAVNLANPVHIPRGVTCKCVTAMVPSDSYHSHHQCWKRSDLTHDLIYVPMPSLARRMISLATTASSLVRVDTTSYTDLCTQAETDNMHTHSPAQPLLPATRASEWTPPPVQIHALTPTPYTCTHTHTHQLGHCCLQLLRQSGHRLLYKFTHSRQHHTHAHKHTHTHQLGHCCLQLLRQSGHRLLAARQLLSDTCLLLSKLCTLRLAKERRQWRVRSR